jgi:hypothetical protein
MVMPRVLGLQVEIVLADAHVGIGSKQAGRLARGVSDRVSGVSDTLVITRLTFPVT